MGPLARPSHEDDERRRVPGAATPRTARNYAVVQMDYAV
jgi:hypothetical protein